jgi:formylglycine-generating enzyme required for sulfatase activity/predicted Ser/Thr protein kinase
MTGERRQGASRRGRRNVTGGHEILPNHSPHNVVSRTELAGGHVDDDMNSAFRSQVCSSVVSSEREVSSQGDDIDIVLREVVHAPPRPPNSVRPGIRWGESGRYVIDRLLGRGGMGAVYAASDELLGRVIALKVLDATPVESSTDSQNRLLREAKVAAQIEHDRIARIYDAGRHEGRVFVAMEYIRGSTLRDWMNSGNTRSSVEILEIVTQIGEGLAALHGKGVVHRDLKPENVMLDERGQVKLLDFGLARHVAFAEESTDSGEVNMAIADGISRAEAAGTPGYMAPEQCAGQAVDARADIFALGVILHELVTGERPFQGATGTQIMRATLHSIPTLASDRWCRVPSSLRDHTARMLARDPALRHPDAIKALAALRDVAAIVASERLSEPKNAFAASPALAPTVAAISLVVRPPLFRLVVSRVVEAVGVIAALMLVTLSLVSLGSPPLVPPPGMILIDAGRLEVGRSRDEIEIECREIGVGCDLKQLQLELPRTEVAVDKFFLDRNEVTNDEFVKMLNMYKGILSVSEDDDYHYPRFVRRNTGTGSDGEVLVDLNARYGGVEYVRGMGYKSRPGHERRPASQVSWYGAELFCESNGKRLPTEDEWEAAARGREDRPFPWGDEPVRCGDVVIPNDGRIRMPRTCAATTTAQAVGVAAQDVTPDGVHDLAGNVAEWTSSVFVERGRRGNPATSPSDSRRVIRGGSWGDSLMARSSGRNRRPPVIMGANLGFRCALTADGVD